jgi:tetratricopeptide (TPR) repeat protein/predicted Ser/Thr protein kinase
MTALPDRDDRVMSLMATALTLGAEERSRYLRVASEWEERMGGFLRRPWLSLQDLERPFKVGQVINERFEIVREIGHGGMGIVYEAFDCKRGQRIAIKSAKLGFRRLLSPELESALKVRHQNICLVNEIHTASTDYGDIDFLTMEMLEGPTLQEVLSGQGPLEPAEALEIARQLCAGLAEAHRTGVLHKDLKTANVIVTETPDGRRRAVITDFGLAGAPAAEGGELAGTPRYMAPELWRGASASRASDIYALGVIFHEMVTGAPPFGDQPSDICLTRRPPSAATRSQRVPRQFDAAISRCLDPNPAGRPSDAMAVLAALTPRTFRKAPLFAAITVVGVVAAASVIMREPPHMRLAILPAQGTGNAAALANVALNDVADRLAPTLVVMRPEQIAKAEAHTPDEARRDLKATHALQLAVRQEGGALVVHAAVIDLATQTRIEELTGLYAASNAGDLSTALTGAVSKALKLRGTTEEPISAAAATPYAAGLAYLRRDQHGFDQALPLFREAVRLDPHAAKARAGVVEALVLKYQASSESRWLTEAEQELKAATALDPDSIAVLLAGGRLNLVRGRYEKALAGYERVAQRQPRNVEVLIRVAELNDRLNRRQEAVESYQKAIALDPDYYETYQELGSFYFKRGEYLQAMEQFRKVVARAPRFYPAYTNLGGTLKELGRYDEAEQALRTSLSIKTTAGALNNLAAAKADQKRDLDAIELYKKAYALDPRNYMYLMNLGDSSRRAGLAAKSEQYYREARDAALNDLQINPRSGRTRAYVAYLEARLGDSPRGQQEMEQALELEPNDKVVIRRAVVMYEMLGQRGRALEIAETAPSDVLRELDRQPDLADFRRDPRFSELKAKREKGG